MGNRILAVGVKNGCGLGPRNVQSVALRTGGRDNLVVLLLYGQVPTSAQLSETAAHPTSGFALLGSSYGASLLAAEIFLWGPVVGV